MTAALEAWWQGRTPREQRLLLVMLALLAAVLAWLLVVRPLADALDAAKARHAAAVDAAGMARARAATTAGHAVRSPAAPRPVDAHLSRTATEAGFADARIAAQGPDRAAIAIDAARPQAFFAWVRQMEGQGLAVESLTARANQDRTLAVEAAFRARAG